MITHKTKHQKYDQEPAHNPMTMKSAANHHNKQQPPQFYRHATHSESQPNYLQISVTIVILSCVVALYFSYSPLLLAAAATTIFVKLC